MTGHEVDPIMRRLATLRAAKRINGEDMARRVDISPSALYDYERGRYVPRLDVVRRLAEELGEEICLAAPAPPTCGAMVGACRCGERRGHEKVGAMSAAGQHKCQCGGRWSGREGSPHFRMHSPPRGAHTGQSSPPWPAS